MPLGDHATGQKAKCVPIPGSPSSLSRKPPPARAEVNQETQTKEALTYPRDSVDLLLGP